MKKLLVIVVLALVIASVMLAATGCGDSGNGDGDENGTVMNGTMNGDDGEVEDLTDYSVVGTYESDEGTYITLAADGTFETDAWEGMKEGTYKATQDEEDYWWVELTFEDGSLAELSVIIAMGEVAALFDDFTMVQFDKM
ncbi:MAG: hypothetical protein JW854_00140 [Actinobacteria bacterium]|nr:hypothetical protein [Actinomycetota bacterium]